MEFVDLAGSERLSALGNVQSKESIDINKSLFFLRQVIVQLSDISTHQKEYSHIPFRESKLTSLLKKSLGGNSYALMIACITPIDYFLDETISTLDYAAKASYITNTPI